MSYTAADRAVGMVVDVKQNGGWLQWGLSDVTSV